MKRINKKGFTLVELLAIIAILGILAVITVPAIKKVMEQSKAKLAVDSAYGYQEAINNYYATELMNNRRFNIEDSIYTVEQMKQLGLSINGKEPDSNSWIVLEENSIKNGCLQFGKYKVDIKDGNVGSAIKEICGEAPFPFATLTADSDNSGTLTTGDLVCIDNTQECFFVMRSDDDTTILLSQYNLNVGDHSKGTPTGLQDSEVRGNTNNGTSYGGVKFSNSNYWTSNSLHGYVYTNEKENGVYKASIAEYVEDYKSYLETNGAKIKVAKLFSLDDLNELGNEKTMSWIRLTSFWMGTLYNGDNIYFVSSFGPTAYYNSYNSSSYGVRPVIEIETSYIK